MIDYAVFILTYGRPDKVITYDNMRKGGYTGKIFLVCSDDDKLLSKYQDKYKDEVIVFNKDNASKRFDIGDNFNDNRVVVFARNEVFYIAENLGYEYFMVMDDDYQEFRYICNEKGEYKQKKVRNLDKIFNIYFKYYASINALCIAPIQGGDLIGGKCSSMFSGGLMKRKVMNVWFLSTKRKFKIVGRINEDATTYIVEGIKGGLFLQVPDFRIDQLATQQSSGGLTEFYLSTGTYLKSFYSVMFAPSCVKVKMMPAVKYPRLHHSMKWNNACPKILEEKWKRS